MNEAPKDPWAKPFANGYEYFCSSCGQFFSIDTSVIPDAKLSFCPWCGDDAILSTQREFIRWCLEHGEDPINHFHVLDGDESVPGSKYQVTPNQLWSVIGAQRSLDLLDVSKCVENLAIEAELSETIVSDCLKIMNEDVLE